MKKPRYCQNHACGCELVKRDSETRFAFSRRKHCNSECQFAAKVERYKAYQGTCYICGSIFHPHPKRSLSDFRLRRFCSRKCAAESERRGRGSRLVASCDAEKCAPSMPGVAPNAFKNFDRTDFKREKARYADSHLRITIPIVKVAA